MDIKIVIAEESSLIRRGLSSMMQALSLPAFGMNQQCILAGEAASSAELQSLLGQHHPDIAILGYSLTTSLNRAPLAGMDGLKLLRWLNQTYPALNVILLSPYANATLIRQALKEGARSYLSRDINEKTLSQAIATVLKGEIYIESQLVNMLFRHEKTDVEKLSPREIDVLRLICNGLNLKEIAHHMHLSIKTVSAHKVRAMEKLDVKNDCQLYSLIIKNQMFDIRM
ncbi:MULTISPECIES: LuxR C-terminal-related transcriptional regulator [Enterobacter cloacae complex]|uniref:Response regulator transcription factor n=1 Tax=Enterobacter cloacae TaxID=550 RepID=A0A7H8UE65_ENTCL|nr:MULTISPECIES: response regulator transcription factor [Enterobacter cloacae complex]MDE4082845.1 response regulator transcription factor [Enterobacter pasteurii]QKZ97714.1 response regulator transcription factor [Enterobacter cloacae]